MLVMMIDNLKKIWRLWIKLIPQEIGQTVVPKWTHMPKIQILLLRMANTSTWFVKTSTSTPNLKINLTTPTWTPPSNCLLITIRWLCNNRTQVLNKSTKINSLRKKGQMIEMYPKTWIKLTNFTSSNSLKIMKFQGHHKLTVIKISTTLRLNKTWWEAGFMT
jgi:hypothetical protein